MADFVSSQRPTGSFAGMLEQWPVSRRRRLLIVAVPGILAVCLAGLVLAAAQSAAPVGEVWILDRLDQIGGHPTTILGNPRVIDTPLGKAIEFDGVDDAIFLDVHPLAGAETFTWEVVFRPDSGGAPEQRFFHLQEQDPKTHEDTQTRLLFETRLTAGRWYLDSFAFSPSGSKALIDRTLLHTVDTWHSAALVYDGKEMRNYVDGVQQSAAEVRLSPQGQGHTSLGVRINRVDYFKGAIRMARMTRRPLKPEEFLKVK